MNDRLSGRMNGALMQIKEHFLDVLTTKESFFWLTHHRWSSSTQQMLADFHVSKIIYPFHHNKDTNSLILVSLL